MLSLDCLGLIGSGTSCGIDCYGGYDGGDVFGCGDDGGLV